MPVSDEYYMVHDDLWARSGMKPHDGQLCIGCLEDSLGRRLVPGDFTSVPVNEPGFMRKSARLLSRLGERL
jgi:hypothetical protein